MFRPIWKTTPKFCQSLRSTAHVFYIISFLAIIICSIPLFAKNQYKTSTLLKLFYAEFHSNALLYASIAIMGSTTPMIIFLLCDVIIGTLRSALIQLYRLGTILCPCAIIILCAVPNNSLSVLIFAFTSQSILHLSGFLARIYVYGNEKWPFHSAVIVLILWSSVLCLRMQMLLFEFSFSFFVIETLLSVLGLVIYTFHFFKWIIHIVQQLKNNGELSIEEYIGTKNAVILMIAVIIRFIVTGILEHSNASGSLVILLVSQNLASLLVVVLHEYVLRNRVSRMEVSACNEIVL